MRQRRAFVNTIVARSPEVRLLRMRCVRRAPIGTVRGGIPGVDVADVILTVGAYAMKSGTRARRRPVALGLASMLYCYPY